ncbi:MAG: futalosine hydrolase [Trueperaceae bacterium]|nr:MAG: futalosine hydrolase [Trueperaceae bacterium]
MNQGSVLLITATRLEAQPLRDLLTDKTDLDLLLGEGVEGTLFGARVQLLHLGVGKVNTAAGLALAIASLRPRAVIQFGIGGAYIGSFLSVCMVVAAEQDMHIDSGVKLEQGWRDMRFLELPLVENPKAYNRFPTDPDLTRTFEETIGMPAVSFGTSETVTGNFDDAARYYAQHEISVESMEGAAAAQVCTALGVPFAELRSISNIVGERNKRAWNIPGAVRAVNDVVVLGLKNMFV